MLSLQITTSILGLGLAVLILRLLRQDRLYIRHAVFWTSTAVAAAVLGLWPKLIDIISMALGISFPPAALLLLACLVLLLKALYADILHTETERNIRRLNQRLALLEVEIEKLKPESIREQ